MVSGTKLVIVESPAKATKIQGYLGDQYTVMASVGHIRDLAQPSQVPSSKKEKYGKFGVDIQDGFKPYYIISADKKDTVAKLKNALKNATELYLATDEDREGEAIAWHLVQTLKPKIPVKRMTFQEITQDAIHKSLDHTRDIDQNMVAAQETRRILDRLYGYELSPVLWKKIAPKLSAGRVQSVVTRMIVERERERIAFVSATYCDLVAHFTADNTSFDARFVELNNHRLVTSKDFDNNGQLIDKAQLENAVHIANETAQTLSTLIQGKDFTVESNETRPYTRHAEAPFTTSTLQQVAGNRLHMPSRTIMRLAQALYENGFITYMRTDSVTLSDEAIQAARQTVRTRFGEDYLSPEPRQFKNTVAGAQEAHEAIRPAGSEFRSPEDIADRVTPEQLQLYTLIWQRTVASQMADVVGDTSTIHLATEIENYGKAVFKVSGTIIRFPGFSALYKTEKSASTPLPDLAQGTVVAVNEITIDQHATQPPARFTESSLVGELEDNEIGRPSTYASIISTVIDRGYVYERKRQMIPSWLAFCVVHLLELKFPQLIDYAFTARMEKGLDHIAQGNETELDWLTEFYFGTSEQSVHNAQDAVEGLQQQVSQLGDIDAKMINTIEIGDGINVRVGKYGPYVEDTKNCDSDGTPQRASLVNADIAPDELTVDIARDLIHRNTFNHVLGYDEKGNSVVVRTGRFGSYVALIPPETNEEASKTKTKQKPKMASLFTSMNPDTVTLEQALQLLSLPRIIGTYTKESQTGESQVYTITANNGRYGPYLTQTCDSSESSKPETRTLDSQEEIFTITLAEAQEKFNQPKQSRHKSSKEPLRELGTDPQTGKPVVIKDGFYGAYITDGTTNRTLPKTYTIESIEPEVAFSLLEQKRLQGPTRRTRKTTAKKTTKKRATKVKE